MKRLLSIFILSLGLILTSATLASATHFETFAQDQHEQVALYNEYAAEWDSTGDNNAWGNAQAIILESIDRIDSTVVESCYLDWQTTIRTYWAVTAFKMNLIASGNTVGVLDAQAALSILYYMIVQQEAAATEDCSHT